MVSTDSIVMLSKAKKIKYIIKLGVIVLVAVQAMYKEYQLNKKNELQK
jgi:hypothetical protein